jgi:hypothetical protein
MITNALVATETHLTNGGFYQHIFQEEIFFFNPPNGVPPFMTPIQSFYECSCYQYGIHQLLHDLYWKKCTSCLMGSYNTHIILKTLTLMFT